MIYSFNIIKKTKIICRLADKGIQNIELSGGTDYYDESEYDLLMGVRHEKSTETAG